MTDNELRVKIAEALNWQLYQVKRGEFLLQYCLKPTDSMPWDRVQWSYREEEKKQYEMLPWDSFEPKRFDGWTYLPDWPNNLNAMTEAEATLTIEQQHAYRDELQDIVMSDWTAKKHHSPHIVFSTARQRALAFVQTIAAPPQVPGGGQEGK